MKLLCSSGDFFMVLSLERLEEYEICLRNMFTFVVSQSLDNVLTM
jgi:hypothetical protein